MIDGLLSGVLWALDTVVLGIALGMTPFISTEQAIALAPFVSTCLHDVCSTIWMVIYMGVKKQYQAVVRALKTRSGKFIMLGALMGGPIGMSGYVAAINMIGPAYTAIISSMYPALGAFLSYLFLKEKMKPYQIVALLISIGGIIVLGYSPEGLAPGSNIVLGIACALLCCIGWASEAVILAYGMKDPDINDETALLIRQATSAVFYTLIIIPVVKGMGYMVSVVPTKATAIILLSALFGTASYLYYYRSIAGIGASKAMALNITYSAWALIFSLVLLHSVPDLKSIICGIVIVVASFLAAADLSEFSKK